MTKGDGVASWMLELNPSYFAREPTDREREIVRMAVECKGYEMDVDSQSHSVTLSLNAHMTLVRQLMDLKTGVRWMHEMLACGRARVKALEDSNEAFTLGVLAGVDMVCKQLNQRADAIVQESRERQDGVGLSAQMQSGAIRRAAQEIWEEYRPLVSEADNDRLRQGQVDHHQQDAGTGVGSDA